MKLFTVTLTLIILNCDLMMTKHFDLCEFALELFETHEIPRDEIYKHLCIVSSLHTGRSDRGHLGIYNIGSLWWCREDEPGGSCNVTCSNLLDDDIADDVACANLILSQQGVEAFGTTIRHCKKAYEEKTNECIADADVFDSLVEVSEKYSTVLPTTVRTTSKASPRIFKAITKPAFTTSTSTPLISSTHNPQAEETVHEGGSNAVGWIIVVASIVLMITLFAFKFKSSKSPNVFYRRNYRFFFQI